MKKMILLGLAAVGIIAIAVLAFQRETGRAEQAEMTKELTKLTAMLSTGITKNDLRTKQAEILALQNLYILKTKKHLPEEVTKVPTQIEETIKEWDDQKRVTCSYDYHNSFSSVKERCERWEKESKDHMNNMLRLLQLHATIAARKLNGE